MKLATLMQSARPPFLVLTPVCVFLGFSVANVELNGLLFALVVVGALSAHIAVNALNEYFDFTTGLDLKTNKTPFSGGSGALPNDPDSASGVLWFGVASACLTVGLGLILVWLRGAELLFFGVGGVLLVLLYTPWINRSPIACLIAPGAGFGLFMVLGCQWVFLNKITSVGVLAALVPFFLVNNLLLLNQFPDIKADEQAGRKHLLIRYGLQVGVNVYLLFLVLAALTIIVAVLMGAFPLLSIFSLCFLLPAVFSWRGLRRLRDNIGEEPKFLAMNVMTAISTPLILALTLL